MMNRNSLGIMVALCLCIFYVKAQSENDQSDINEVGYEVYTPMDSTIQKLLDEVCTRFSQCLFSQKDFPLYGVIMDNKDEISFSLRQGTYPKEEDGFFNQIVENNGTIFFFPFSSDYYHFQPSHIRQQLTLSAEQNGNIPYVPSHTWLTNSDYFTLVYKYTNNSWKEYAIHHCVCTENEIPIAGIGQLTLVSPKLSFSSPYVESEARGSAVVYVSLNKKLGLKVAKVTDVLFMWIHDPSVKSIAEDIYYFDDDYCTRENPQYQYYYNIISQVLYSAKCKIKRHPKLEGSSNITISNVAFRKQLSHREPLYIEFNVTPISK